MAAKDEIKLMGCNLRMSGQDNGPNPKRTEFDLNQYPCENKELEPRQGGAVCKDTTEEMEFDLNQYPSENMEERHPIYSNTSHDTPAPDEVSHNMHIQTVGDADHGRSGNVNPIAPKSNSKGKFWCRHCGTDTESSQWRPGPTGERDVCNKHFQRMLRQSKKAEN